MIGGLCLFLFGMSTMGDALERISDHCANVAGCVMDMQQHDLTIHAVMRTAKPGNPEFDKAYRAYSARYVLAEA